MTAGIAAARAVQRDLGVDKGALVGAGIGDRTLDLPDARLGRAKRAGRVLAKVDLTLSIEAQSCRRPECRIHPQIVETRAHKRRDAVRGGGVRQHFRFVRDEDRRAVGGHCLVHFGRRHAECDTRHALGSTRAGHAGRAATRTRVANHG